MKRIGMLLAASLAVGTVHAQGKGAYQGTVTVSGVETGKTSKVTFKAEVKIAMPLTSREADRATAEIGDVDKPSATATITQWDIDARNASPGADGKITSWKCAIAAPTTIPMNAQGVLNIDYRKKSYNLFVALAGVKQIPMKCVHSRSGEYKENRGAALFFGTNEIDAPAKDLPFADPARLAAKHTLVPVSAMKGQFLPLEQDWDFRLVR